MQMQVKALLWCTKPVVRVPMSAIISSHSIRSHHAGEMNVYAFIWSVFWISAVPDFSTVTRWNSQQALETKCYDDRQFFPKRCCGITPLNMPVGNCKWWEWWDKMSVNESALSMTGRQDDATGQHQRLTSWSVIDKDIILMGGQIITWRLTD